MSSLPRSAACIKWRHPWLFVALLASASAGAASVDTASNDRGAAAGAEPAACAAEYSIINLGPAETWAVDNGRGAIVLTVPDLDAAGNAVQRLRTFDGRRMRDHGTFAQGAISLTDMNAHGTVTGQIVLPTDPRESRGFTFTAARGIRLLPSPGPSFASAINDQNQVVGSMRVSDSATRAVLWNPGGARIFLGPQTRSSSRAVAINRFGLSAGIADSLDGITRATIWDSAGRATDLGLPPNGSSAAAHGVNDRGEVVGGLDIETQRVGFYWSRERGMVLIASADGNSLHVRSLNDQGDIAGNVVTSEGLGSTAPFFWSLRGGLRALPLAGASSGRLNGLNNRREMVGYLQPLPFDSASRRAVFWRGAANPVDLNTRLHRAPAGLVLGSATGVNDRGEILAMSNAGLVLLRPGRHGTAAPVLGPILGLPAFAQAPVGATLDLAASFVDDTARETHLATARVTDGCPQGAPTVREARGAGEVNLRHTFCRAGSFIIEFSLRDSAGNATAVSTQIRVTEPVG